MGDGGGERHSGKVVQEDVVLNRSSASFGWAFLAFVGVLYWFTLGRLGWNHSDDGFLIGQSWRVLQGELPFKDVLMMRPLGSVYWHALWMRWVPHDLVFFTGRGMYALELAVANGLAIWVLMRDDLAPRWLSQRWWLWASVAFLCSATMLSPMPWHTVDGLFFGAIGAAFAFDAKGRSSFLSGVLAGVFCALSMLCKQSFYPWPLVLMACLWWSGQRLRLLPMVVGLLLVGFAVGAWMAHHGVFLAFLDQTSSSTTLGDAGRSGVFPYMKALWAMAVPVGLAIAFGFWASTRWSMAWSGAHALAWGLAGVFLVLVGLWIKQPFLHGAFLNAWFEHALWLGASVWVVLCALKGTRQPRLAAMLGLAWLSSVSWGFMSPGLLFAPGLAGTAFWVCSWWPMAPWPKWGRAVSFVALWLVALMGVARSMALEGWPVHAFCDLGRSDRSFSWVWTLQEHCNLVSNAKDVVQSLDSPRVVFLPVFTSAHWAFGLKNPLPTDYPVRTEVGRFEKAVDGAWDGVDYVLVEKHMEPLFARAKPGSRFEVPWISKVEQAMPLVKETPAFRVYRNPNGPLARLKG